MKPKTRYLRHSAFSAAIWLALTPLYAATIDTTGTTITLNSDAPENTYTGNGTLQVSGGGDVELGTGPGTAVTEFAMTGGLIDIVSGTTLINGGWQKGLWTNNKASMNIASGASLHLWDGQDVYVDALTGAGSVVGGPSYNYLFIGVNGGTGIFSGSITIGASLVKRGSGTQTLSGTTNYNQTIIEAGTLEFSGASTLGTGAVSIKTGGTLDLGGTTQALGGNLNASGAGNGAVGNINDGTLNLNGKSAFLQSGTFTMNLTGGGDSRLWIGGDAAATVELGGNNTSTFADTQSTIIGHSTTGTAGTVKLLSATALGPSSQGTQVHSGTVDLNGQTGVSVGQIALFNSSNLVNNNTSTAASFGGNVDFTGVTTPSIGGAGDMTLSGTLVSGGFTKIGAGTLTLSNSSNSYTGATIVNEGTLAIDGTTAASVVTVKTGATLGGTGTVGGATTIESGGHLSVGNSPGTQTFSSTLTFESGSIFDWELNATTTDPGADTADSGAYDKVVANGTVSGTSVFTIALGTNAFTDAFWNTNKSWSDIFTGGGTYDLSTLFTNFGGTGVASSGLVTGQGQFSFTSNTLNWTAVPEPTSALAGLLITAGLLRRRR